MYNVKEYFNRQIILIILTNVFYVHFGLTGILIIGIAGILSMGQNYFSYILFVLFLLLSVSRLFCLPVLYSYLEEHSNNEIIQRFISKLQNSCKFRYILLIIIIFIDLLTISARNIVDGVLWFAIYSCFFSSSFAYIILFLWWKHTGKISGK